ncbi:MAG: alpha/beta hydrolase [candidate division Zixibacteria bacterium]|nr:alpha/beta hydrolase [candidate division Zixibacteria bacterium]
MPTIPSGDVNLYYEETGTGPPVVFLHGLTLDLRMWRRQIDYFSSQYRVVAYDSRGHGRSSCPETGYSVGDRVQDLKNLVTALDLPPFHLVGLSMGGATALGYAIDYQSSLLSLTLVDTSASGYQPPSKIRDMREVAVKMGVEEAKRRWIRTTLFYYANRNEELRRELAEMMAGHCGRLWLDPKRGRYPVRDDVELSSRVTVPTLIIVGEKDRYFLPLARTLHNRIVNSELDIIPGVGHMANMEAPDRFNFRLEQFLQRNA